MEYKHGGQIGQKDSLVRKNEHANELVFALCPKCGRLMHPYSDELIEEEFIGFFL